MGLKNVFKKRDPTEDEIRDHLTHAGIATKSGGARQEKFGAFRNYAHERQQAKPGLAPVNPYASINSGQGGNPYAQQEAEQGGEPQEDLNQDPYQTSSPYGSNGPRNTNPYAGSSRGPSSAATARNSAAPGARAPPPDPYSGRSSRDVYGRSSDRSRDFDEESLDLNAIPSNTMFQGRKPIRKPQTTGLEDDTGTVDLNDLPEEDDLNVEIDDELPQDQEVNSEDEEVEAIKQDIRFVKQESVQSTRNTLRMAQEADASGTNTLGMLGSQSERLYNAEQNLNLADTQSKIAEEKVKQIQRLNRSIFIPANGNPFNKKSRLRMQEQKIKNDKAQEKYIRDGNRRNMYESEQRVKQGITQNATGSELHQKYRGEKDLANAQRYQFENDLEDDEMEKELASNLDQIALYSKKLKNSASTMGQEVESQNGRLRHIEEDADRLDINVHMNNTRLSNIR